MKRQHLDRREFLKFASAGIALAAAGRPVRAASANGKLNIACVGVGGKGWSDMNEMAAAHNIVAICDIDSDRLGRAAKAFPQAKAYADYRKLLEQSDIDGVTVSTPDHMHAPVTMAAMLRDKHVYTQKPLTKTVFESRQLAKVAAERKLITQMGIQHHSSALFRAAVQAVQDGAVGRVSDVHVWTDRPGRFWNQGLERSASSDPVPANVNWDLWLGVAEERPFVNKAYHPFAWRGWWEFGTGALGDMGCHMIDPVVTALELGAPSRVSAEGPPPHPESGPTWCRVQYTFPGTSRTTKTLPMTWYEADQRPDRKLFDAPSDWTMPGNGVLFIGEKGTLFLSPEAPSRLFQKPEFEFPELEPINHYLNWTQAVVDGKQASCPFSYSGPLTETVLLGNVAYRSGAAIDWDSANLKVTNHEAANNLLKTEYRSGWAMPELA